MENTKGNYQPIWKENHLIIEKHDKSQNSTSTNKSLKFDQIMK